VVVITLEWSPRSDSEQVAGFVGIRSQVERAAMQVEDLPTCVGSVHVHEMPIILGIPMRQ